MNILQKATPCAEQKRGGLGWNGMVSRRVFQGRRREKMLYKEQHATIRGMNPTNQTHNENKRTPWLQLNESLHKKGCSAKELILVRLLDGVDQLLEVDQNLSRRGQKNGQGTNLDLLELAHKPISRKTYLKSTETAGTSGHLRQLSNTLVLQHHLGEGKVHSLHSGVYFGKLGTQALPTRSQTDSRRTWQLGARIGHDPYCGQNSQRQRETS